MAAGKHTKRQLGGRPGQHKALVNTARHRRLTAGQFTNDNLFMLDLSENTFAYTFEVKYACLEPKEH